jgi:hypothetical protein
LILPIDSPRQTTVAIVVIALAADRGDAQGDGFGIVGHLSKMSQEFAFVFYS